MKYTAGFAAPNINNDTFERITCSRSPLLSSFHGLSGKIGIYGGTFDPIHVGHVKVAEAVKRKYNLDLVVFIPTAQNPLKSSSPQSTALDRLEMIYSTLENLEDSSGLVVSPIEISKPRPNYTVDTLQAIKAQVATDCKLFLLMGSDCIKNLPAWKNVNEIFNLTDVVVIERDSNALTDIASIREQLGQHVASRLESNLVTTVSTHGISASFIRKAAEQTGLIPEDATDPWVRQYIHDRGLYNDN